TIIGATTYSEFTRATTESDWDSGWLVRWLFAMPDVDYDPVKRTRWATPQDTAQLESFRFLLQELNRRNPSPFMADKDALDHLQEWRDKLILLAMATQDRHERVDAIIERYATYGYKFAMILCAACGDGERITLEHAKAATRLAENYMTNVF